MRGNTQASRRQKELTRQQSDQDVGDCREEDEDDGCAALLALQSAVFEVPTKTSKRIKGQADQQQGKHRAASSSDTGGENGSASSGGSAKDVLMQQLDGQVVDDDMEGEDEIDDLSDMEVQVVSESEKGCQVWFPPLPGEMERRRLQRQQSGGIRQLERQLSAVEGIGGGRRSSKRKLVSAPRWR